MKRCLTSICLLLLACLAMMGQVGDLPRSTPEAEGVDPVIINNLYLALDSNPDIDVHHLMVLRHGKVIGEVHASPYRATDVHMLYSASKTVTGLAVGLAVDDKLLSIDDKVSKYLRDKMPATISPALDSLTVRHLLMMAAGRLEDTDIFMGQEDWLTTWFKGDFHNVGKEFHYDSMATHALAMIVCRLTGKSLLEYVRERIFEPLYITRVDWEMGPDGVEEAGWGLFLHAESQAKIGQLMLQGGKWNGQQVVSEQWIHDMTQHYIRTNSNNSKLSVWQKVKRAIRRVWYYVRSLFTGINYSTYYRGYGFQTKSIVNPWAEAFFAAGYGGQLIYVVPKCDLVVVINGRAVNYGSELKEFNNCLVVPLVTGKKPASLGVHDSFDIAPPAGAATHELEKRLLSNRIALNDNLLDLISIEVDRRGDDLIFTMTDSTRVLQAYAACGQWRITTSDDMPIYVNESQPQLLNVRRPFTSAAAYAWQGNTLVMRLDWLDGGDNRRLSMAFDGDDVTVYASDNFDLKLTDEIHGKLVPRR